MNALGHKNSLHNQPLRYIIKGDPVPLARARFGNRKVWDSQAELKVWWGFELARQHADRPHLKGPIHLDIDFYFTPTPSMSLAKKEKLRGTSHFIRPDLSNLIKFIEDIGTGILYKDDCLIASICASKFYDLEARTEFVLTEIK